MSADSQRKCEPTIFAVLTELGHMLHMFLDLFLQGLLSDAPAMEGLDQTVQVLHVRHTPPAMQHFWKHTQIGEVTVLFNSSNILFVRLTIATAYSVAVWAIDMFSPAYLICAYWQRAVLTLWDGPRIRVVLGFGPLYGSI